MVPEFGGMTADKMRSRVVLPLPLIPRIPILSPAWTPKLAPEMMHLSA
jgi:hypothetical protein